MMSWRHHDKVGIILHCLLGIRQQSFALCLMDVSLEEWTYLCVAYGFAFRLLANKNQSFRRIQTDTIHNVAVNRPIVVTLDFLRSLLTFP